MQIIDLHNDVITSLTEKQFKKYIRRAEKAGVKSILISVWMTEMPDPLNEIARARRIINNTKTTIKLLLHVEDCHFLTPENVDLFLSFRPFSVGLTWNYDNNLAGGAVEKGQLTQFGREITAKFCAEKIVLDTAHLNRESFFDVLKIAGGNVICTHTCFNAVTAHARNLTDAQIQKIIDIGGIVGVTFVRGFLGGKTINHLCRHIQYFLQNFGEDNLAVGTDFYGAKPLKRLKNYRHFKFLEKKLLQCGVTQSAVNKIFFENAKRLLNSYKTI
jgi:microsomal dipeptidase-like Zn-dependent dipeptidase